jgi:AI-2 transport protein TqsA
MDKLSSRPVIILLVVASSFVIMFGIRGAASILSPIILAAVITITVLPIPIRLKKRGMPGWLSLLLSIGLVALILGAVIVTVFFSIRTLSTELPQYLDSASQQYSEDISSLTGTETSTESSGLPIELGVIAQSILTMFVDVLVQMGFSLFIFFFMISAAVSLPGPARLGLDPDSPLLGRVVALTEDVRKYISVLTLINILVGLGDTIFLLIMGVDYALLWGLLAWFMGYIPSIGFMIALIPPVLMAYAQYDLQTALIVLVGYILINGGVENFVKPKRMGDSLNILPLVVFLGLFVWGFMLGGFGAILAVPLTMLLLIILENIEGTRPLAMLMRYTGKDKEAPPTDDSQL